MRWVSARLYKYVNQGPRISQRGDTKRVSTLDYIVPFHLVQSGKLQAISGSRKLSCSKAHFYKLTRSPLHFAIGSEFDFAELAKRVHSLGTRRYASCTVRMTASLPSGVCIDYVQLRYYGSKASRRIIEEVISYDLWFVSCGGKLTFPIHRSSSSSAKDRSPSRDLGLMLF